MSDRRSRAGLIRHLDRYWKLEAGNALLVLAFGAWLAQRYGGITPAFGPAALACALLLIIGAIAWRLELAGLCGDRRFGARWLP